MSAVAPATYSGTLPVKRRQDSKVGRLDRSLFKKIDEHVRNAPESAAESVQSLAEYLASGATSELEKVRAVYMWVTDNIRYDVAGAKDEKVRLSCDPGPVLRNRVCVCEGFATLVQFLCKRMGIECRRIYGFSKGDGYSPLKPLPLENGADHVWNVVKVDGAWRFIEATWGAGRLVKGRLVKDSTEFYFLTDPDVFLEEHFPNEKKDPEYCKAWQLLEDPIDLDTFQKRAKRTPHCFEQQVELLTHGLALIEAGDQVTLKFRGAGNRLTRFSAHFVDPSTGDILEDNRHVAAILDHRTNEATVVARAPGSCAGYWELEVFGNTEVSDCSTMYVSYQVRFREFSEPVFPSMKDHYGLQIAPSTCALVENLAEFAASNDFWVKVEGGQHQLVIPLAKQVECSATLCSSGDSKEKLEGACLAEDGDKMLRIWLRLPRLGFYSLGLFMSTGEGDSCELDVAYLLVECTSCAPGLLPFPELNWARWGPLGDPMEFGFTDEFRRQRFVIQAEHGGEHELRIPRARAAAPMLIFTFAKQDDNARFALVECEQGVLRIRLRMHQAGFHKLQLLCRRSGSTSDRCVEFANFLIECTEPMARTRPFPSATAFARKEQAILESPLDGDLPANTEVRFKLRSPTIVELLVNNNEYKSSGSGFDFTMNTGAAGQELLIYGAVEPDAEDYENMYAFNVVEAE